MNRLFSLKVILPVLIILNLPALIFADEDPAKPDSAGILSLQVENDLWGGGTDRYYTHGTRLSYLSSEETP